MSRVVPFSAAKSHPSALADEIEREHERIVVTRNGHPSFVLVSSDDLASLEETLDVLRDQDLVDSIERSRQEAATGTSASRTTSDRLTACTRSR